VSGATLDRRLANYRAALRPPADRHVPPNQPYDLAERLATALDGEIVRGELGTVVRCEPLTVVLPVDRERLRSLPGQPPADVPLVCLDTETTGLATASGTVAFLVGLGWWEGDRFRQAQLLLPDQPDEPALLAMLAAHIPANGWLVTYNGRAFDWPLLVARYRMARRDPPPHAGHLDLLPLVRRVFRHRMTDARLRSVETELLGVERHEEVEGWEIPSRYLAFLRHGDAGPLADILRHNREDVRSLARLIAHVDVSFADVAARRTAPRGDLAGLARAFSRERRFEEALDCLESALAAPLDPPVAGQVPSSRRTDDEEWWAPRHRADFGGRPARPSEPIAPARLDAPWTEERILVDRARLLRRLGRFDESAAAWGALAIGTGPIAAHAWVEVSKLREHRLADLGAALEAALGARAVVDVRRRLGLIDPALERGLARRLERLRRRELIAGSGGDPSVQPAVGAAAGTSGSRSSTVIEPQVSLTQSSSGSNEQAIVRRSPARALR
jgi:tetratricopeptide (TPR) repeat protein